ncbi:transposase [bacterium 19CA03SA04]|uniref:Transposase n=2 Tax=Bacteria TaxID=2 RepID=A0AAU6T1C7_UNCXX|nr:transposase [Vibrio navarrensis]
MIAGISRMMYLTGRIYNKSEHRMTLEGILFRMRTGIPWRDLPEEFRDWNTVFRRFNLWSKKGVMRDLIKSRNAQHVIPRKGNSKQGNDDIDWCLYRYRHLVENAFLKVKKYRAVATRYEKLARNYESMVALAFSLMWLPMWVD